MDNFQSHIINEGMVYDGKDYWLIEKNSNWLCKLSADMLTCEYIAQIPCEKNNVTIATNVVGNIYNSFVVCLPLRTNILWKYNILDGKIDKIQLPIRNSPNLYINSSWIIDNSIWLASCTGRVWKVSLENNEVLDWYDLNDSSENISMGPEFIYHKDHIYGVSDTQGIIYDFNINTKKTSKFILNEDVKGFHTLCKLENALFFTGKTEKIYKYDCINNKFSKYNLFNSEINSEKHLYVRSAVYKEKIVLVPWLPKNVVPNEILIFDTKTEIVDVLKIDGEQAGFCLLGTIGGSNLYFGYSNKDSLYVYNFSDSELKEIKYIISNKDARNEKLLKNGFVSEQPNLKLKDYIDYVCRK